MKLDYCKIQKGITERKKVEAHFLNIKPISLGIASTFIHPKCDMISLNRIELAEILEIFLGYINLPYDELFKEYQSLSTSYDDDNNNPNARHKMTRKEKIEDIINEISNYTCDNVSDISNFIIKLISLDKEGQEKLLQSVNRCDF